LTPPNPSSNSFIDALTRTCPGAYTSAATMSSRAVGGVVAMASTLR
jgi:hypothetical protein